MKQDNPIAPKSILFVCLGNICRSPIAEGLFRHIARQTGVVDRFVIDSAGLGSWHVGNPPDERAQSALLARGVHISDLRARQVTLADFDEFDIILAMDRTNSQGLLKLAPKDKQNKVHLMMEFAPNLGVREIPDPYFGGKEGFDYVCQLVDAAARGLLHNLMSKPSSATLSGRPVVPAKG